MQEQFRLALNLSGGPMKQIILLALLVSSGCIKSSEETAPAVTTRRFDPISVAPEDQSRLKVICDALASKEERLPTLEGSEYTFALAERGCNEAEPVEEKEIKVTIHREGSHHIFRRPTGENFAFSNVETATSGVMSVICANIHDLRSPLQTSSKGAVWFTTFANQRDCASDFNSMCIYLAKGEHVGDVNYRVHSEEWIKFKVRDERSGFFIERRLVGSADCSEGKTMEKRARLN